MKTFTFEFQAKGTCYTEIQAETIEEAYDIIKRGETDYFLSDWDMELPQTLDNKTLKKHLASEDENE